MQKDKFKLPNLPGMNLHMNFNDNHRKSQNFNFDDT